jgi:DNA mismatch endonuclease (patch repair protein)
LVVIAGDVKVKPDVVFTKRRVAVFMDGCFWHSCPSHGNRPRRNAHYWLPKLERNVRRDTLVADALRADGWTVIRMWEHDIRSNLSGAVDLIASDLTGR